MEAAADAPDRGAPGGLKTQLSDDSETLPKHRHGVKDYFPICVRDVPHDSISQAIGSISEIEAVAG